MPFSDEEPILEEPKSRFKSIILILSAALFVLSLFNFCFCTVNNCRTSIEALLIGWIAMLTGGAAISWLANPFLITAWILLTNNKKSAWVFALIAVFFSATFLNFKVVIQNEAGQYAAITRVGLGYWLWLTSCTTTFIGCLTLRWLQRHNLPGQKT